MPSKILHAKTDADILSPSAKPFAVAGKEFDVFPMPDRILMGLGDALGHVIGVAKGLKLFEEQQDSEGNILRDGLGNPVRAKLTLEMIAPLLPELVKILVPNATQIIAGCLRQPEEWVAENVGFAKKLEALALIIEAEDIPLILRNFTRLTGLFTEN